MEIPRELNHILVSDSHTLSGAVRFRNTRVPVQALLDTLTRGLPVSDFLEGFPDVSEFQAQAVVEWEQNQARRASGRRIGIVTLNSLFVTLQDIAPLAPKVMVALENLETGSFVTIDS